MGQRLSLHQILKDILGTEFVYFQPPGSQKLTYPGIVYHRDFAKTEHADNYPFRSEWRYMVTFIFPTHTETTEAVLAELLALQKCSFDRSFTADNLHHYVYKLFF